MTQDQRLALSEIIERAQLEVTELTGLPGKLKYVQFAPPFTEENCKALFSQMCEVWQVDLRTVKIVSKLRERCIMRKVLWFAAVTNFPTASRKRLAKILNRTDHSSVVRAVEAAEFFLKHEDPLFMAYYNPVKHFFNDK
jgi:hypothetical protein